MDHYTSKVSQSKLFKRRAVAMLAISAAFLLPLYVTAQPWPGKPTELVVPFATGGSNHNIARVLRQKLGARLRQRFVAEREGCGSGGLGTDYVANSAPDGNALLLMPTPITTKAATGKKFPYDFIKDLQPIGMAAASPFAAVVAPTGNLNSLKELIDLASLKLPSINYGATGIGGMSHLGTELLASAAKIRLKHIPSKDNPFDYNHLMGGNLQMLLLRLASVTGQIKVGKLQGLAVTDAQAPPLALEPPTVSEMGVAGFELEVWFGLKGPAGMPVAVTRPLNTVLATPDVKGLLDCERATARLGTPEELAALIRGGVTRRANLIKDNNT